MMKMFPLCQLWRISQTQKKTPKSNFWKFNKFREYLFFDPSNLKCCAPHLLPYSQLTYLLFSCFPNLYFTRLLLKPNTTSALASNPHFNTFFSSIHAYTLYTVYCTLYLRPSVQDFWKYRNKLQPHSVFIIQGSLFPFLSFRAFPLSTLRRCHNPDPRNIVPITPLISYSTICCPIFGDNILRLVFFCEGCLMPPRNSIFHKKLSGVYLNFLFVFVSVFLSVMSIFLFVPLGHGKCKNRKTKKITSWQNRFRNNWFFSKCKIHHHFPYLKFPVLKMFFSKFSSP